MITHQELCRKLEVLRFGAQPVSLAGVIRAEVNRTVPTTDTDLHIAEVFRTDRNLRVVHF